MSHARRNILTLALAGFSAVPALATAPSPVITALPFLNGEAGGPTAAGGR